MPWFAAVLAGLVASPAVPDDVASDGKVAVTVSGIRNDHGLVRVALCTKTDFPGKHCAYQASAPAQQGVVTVSLAGVPSGPYAAQGWHDESGEGHMTRSTLGLPREGFGFSNDPALLLGPPGFEDAAFTVGSRGARVSMRLRYLRQ